MKRIDFYILFLFAVQVYIFFSQSSWNYSLSNIVSYKSGPIAFAFGVYVFAFIFLFLNMFSLFLASKAAGEKEKRFFMLSALLGTIIFFILSFGFDLLVVLNSK